MTNKEILKKAIEKAKKNEWKNPYTEFEEMEYYECLIFSHDFAKAFWGEEKADWGNYYQGIIPCWKYHLSKMVLEDEPLKYLEKFLDT